MKFSPAKLEAILSNEGRIIGVKILDPGAYYFDRHFGRQWDSRGRSIFDYNYTEDDLRTLDINRSALYEFRDLCQKLDSDNDGVADYSPPVLKIDGVDETSSFDISIENICVSWVAFLQVHWMESRAWLIMAHRVYTLGHGMVIFPRI